MEEVAHMPSLEYIPPPLPPKSNPKNSTYTQITSDETKLGLNGYKDGLDRSLGSMHPVVLNTKAPTTVFVAATQAREVADARQSPANIGRHVVTIRINTDQAKPIAPKISSVHLKSESEFDPFKYNDLNKKNNSLVRVNVDETLPKILENNELQRSDKDKAPYIYCNSYSLNSNMVMSSGQCSPSDTLDSGTCSDLDSTPPPLPKKKSFRSSNKKAVTVTLISPPNNGNGHNSEVDFEDNDSNISCDSLNSSELNSVHTDESHCEGKKEDAEEPSTAPDMPAFTQDKEESFLPRTLLQDIRARSAKLNTIETESDEKIASETDQNVNENANLSKESELTSFRLVTLANNEQKTAGPTSLPIKSPIITEATYEERKNEDKQRMCYSGSYFDTDKYYDFHLNEKQFDEKPVNNGVCGVSVYNSEGAEEVEYFAGLKDFKSEAPSTIKSSKGTIRGVKNRVRAGIATFLQIQSTVKVS